MGKKLFLVTLLLMLVCNFASADKGWKEYHNTEFGLTMSVPNDWKISTGEVGPFLMEAGGEKTISNCNLLAVPYNGAQFKYWHETSQKYRDTIANGLVGAYRDDAKGKVELQQNEIATINGTEFLSVVMVDHVTFNEPQYAQLLLFVRNNKLAGLSITRPLKATKLEEETFTKIVNSVKLPELTSGLQGTMILKEYKNDTLGITMLLPSDLVQTEAKPTSAMLRNQAEDAKVEMKVVTLAPNQIPSVEKREQSGKKFLDGLKDSDKSKLLEKKALKISGHPSTYFVRQFLVSSVNRNYVQMGTMVDASYGIVFYMWMMPESYYEKVRPLVPQILTSIQLQQPGK